MEFTSDAPAVRRHYGSRAGKGGASSVVAWRPPDVVEPYLSVSERQRSGRTYSPWTSVPIAALLTRRRRRVYNPIATDGAAGTAAIDAEPRDRPVTRTRISRPVTRYGMEVPNRDLRGGDPR